MDNKLGEFPTKLVEYRVIRIDTSGIIPRDIAGKLSDEVNRHALEGFRIAQVRHCGHEGDTVMVYMERDRKPNS